MRIGRLDLVRYGKFEGKLLELPRAERDIHIIVGPNEAGKSTIGAAIRELLFGIEKSSPHAFLHRGDTRIGADIEHQGQELAFHRSKGLKATLRTPQDGALPDGALAHFLGATDRRSFVDMFGLDHTRLVAGGTSILGGAGDVGKILFEAAAGVGNLGAVQQALDDEANALWDVRKSQTRAYYIAAGELEAATTQLREAVVKTKDWSSAQANVAALDDAHDAARTRYAAVKTRRTQLERVRRVTPHLDALAQASAQLRALGDVAELPADAAATANKAGVASIGAQATLDDQSALELEAQTSLDSIPIDRQILDAGADIRALDDRRIQIQPYEVDIKNRQAEIDAHWNVAVAMAGQLGFAADDEGQLQNALPSAMQRKAMLRLIREHGALAQALDSAKQAAAAKLLELEQGVKALEQLAGDDVPEGLEAALIQAQKLGDVEALRLEREAVVKQKRAALESALAEMGPWPLELVALRAMTPPTPDLVQSLCLDQVSDDTEARSARARGQALRDKVQAQQLAIRQFTQAHHPVTREQVLHARETRESSWQVIRSDTLGMAAKAPAYERLVAEADALADQHHDKIQQASELQSLHQQLERFELDAVQAAADVQRLEEATKTRAAEWAELARRCGLPVLPFQAAGPWLAARRRALDAADELGTAERSLSAYRHSVEVVRAKLGSELATVRGTAGNEALAVLQARATALHGAAAAAKGERASLTSQNLRASVALRGLESEVQRASEKFDAWQAQWRDATGSWRFARMDDLGAVESALEAAERIEGSLAAMTHLRVTRVDAMRADLDAHAKDARALSLRIAPALADLPAAEIVLGLHARWRAATAASEEASRWATAKESAAAKARDASALLTQSRAALAPLFERSKTATMAELLEAIERSDQVRALRTAVAAAEKSMRDGGDALTLDELQAEASTVEKETLRVELDELVQREDALMHELSEIAAQKQAATTVLNAIAGHADAARAEGFRQEALAKMAAAVERYLAVRTASRLLKWSIDQYRDAKQGPMLAVASDIFAKLTLGSFERLSVDYEGKQPRLQGRRPDGEVVDIEGLSDGTRDQLYLALRLAALETHLDKAHPLPFIADDLFINYSDGRSRAGLAALGELSRKTQVIFLTHHEHLIPVVEEVLGTDANVVRL
ncbi:uncharacterized protein YhaN [Variovorax paradoxus]|uniref:YhaN family protein n=1 Tax=Variovorax paradoxus TaxID=34073 RepID=UPI002789A5CD|nr:YhaN family protein [Variovorax paradoxus]MDQ0025031.1 uncharacterized protein YhaN [Variovorax paradoxus]